MYAFSSVEEPTPVGCTGAQFSTSPDQYTNYLGFAEALTNIGLIRVVTDKQIAYRSLN